MNLRRDLYKVQSDLAFLLVILGGALYFAIFYNLIQMGLNSFSRFQVVSNSEICRELGYNVGSISSISISEYIVGVGIIYMSLSIIIAFVSVSLKIFRTRAYISERSIMKREEQILIFKSSELQCFTEGFLFQKVYISDSLHEKLSNDQLDCILSHEEGHVSSHHQLKNTVVEVILRVLLPLGLHRSVLTNNSILNEIVADRYAMEKGITEASLLSTMKDLYEISNPVKLSVVGFGSQISRVRSITEKGHLGSIRYLLQLVVITFLSFFLFSVTNKEAIKVSAMIIETNREAASCIEVLNEEQNQSLPK